MIFQRVQRPNPKILHEGHDKYLAYTEIGWTEVPDTHHYLVESFEPRYGFPYTTTDNFTKINHYLENIPKEQVMKIRGTSGTIDGYSRKPEMHVIITAIRDTTRSKPGFISIPLKVTSLAPVKMNPVENFKGYQLAGGIQLEWSPISNAVGYVVIYNETGREYKGIKEATFYEEFM